MLTVHVDLQDGAGVPGEGGEVEGGGGAAGGVRGHHRPVRQGLRQRDGAGTHGVSLRLSHWQVRWVTTRNTWHTEIFCTNSRDDHLASSDWVIFSDWSAEQSCTRSTLTSAAASAGTRRRGETVWTGGSSGQRRPVSVASRGQTSQQAGRRSSYSYSVSPLFSWSSSLWSLLKTSSAWGGKSESRSPSGIFRILTAFTSSWPRRQSHIVTVVRLTVRVNTTMCTPWVSPPAPRRPPVWRPRRAPVRAAGVVIQTLGQHTLKDTV